MPPSTPVIDDRRVVLVVDDNAALRSVVQRALEAVQLRVLTGASALEGLALLATTQCQLAISDLTMPDMDGWEFCRRARALYPQLALGLMTGWQAPEQTLLAAYGIRFVALKPFNIRELQAQVLAVLPNGGQRLEQG